MPERIFIGAAWPYANSSLHLGHVAGAYLPADIFARYHRVKGNDVLFVSGSDQHGTPVTVRADEEGTTPEAVVRRYHTQFLESFTGLGISFDLYTTTGTENHRQTVQEFFLRLLERGYIYEKTMSMPYCLISNRFLPDRYVEGTCPNCGFRPARGDQCESCGRPMDPKDLKGIVCRRHGDEPVFRDTEHFFLKLSAFEKQLIEWVSGQAHWRGNVRNFTSQYLAGGLHDRSITRDLEWGVPIPVPGYDDKRIYVWFEAVIGYLSASKEWARSQGSPDAWRRFWYDDVKSYYFIGKDNIPFHTIVWPAQLMGYDPRMKLPYDVPANEFLNLEGMKFSKSRNWAVWVPDYLEEFQPDPLRYVLSINMPETGDTDFTWREFIRRNNDELVATYGNLVNRVLSFTYRACDGRTPEPSAQPDAGSQSLIARAEQTVQDVDRLIAACRFKDGIKAAMDLAREANRYLEEQAPWKRVKTDVQGARNALYTGMVVISALKTVLYPYLPFSLEKVHQYLGFEGTASGAGWALRRPRAGTPLAKPEPLFAKLDEEAISEKMASAGQTPHSVPPLKGREGDPAGVKKA